VTISAPQIPALGLAPAGDDRLRAKRRRLWRMRGVATGLLVAMVVLLVCSVALKPDHPWLGWVEAFAEAAVVGAVADWFAVVALFHHPLGLPIPHTAIVPRNKDRIGGELGRFVERNFLTPDNIVAKLAQIDLVAPAASWLATPEHSRMAAAGLRSFLPRLIHAIDDAEVQRILGRVAAERIGAVDVGKLTGRVLAAVTAGGRHQVVLDQILRRISVWLDRNRALIKQKFGAQSSFTPAFVDLYIVNRFVDGIIDLIADVAVTPDHELRQYFDTTLHDFAERLRSEQSFPGRTEQIKREILQGLALDKAVQSVWAAVKQQILTDAAAENSTIEANLVQALQHLAGEIANDPALADRLNAGLVTVMKAGLLRWGPQVSVLIEEVVRRWDARDIAAKIELEVGSDLQFVRLNGTIVGGAVGLVLQAALVLLGLR
jgi:uncharacterized membrane-anchored protein YjiN (DUF445 family)